MNEILWLGFALLDLSMVAALFALFGREGLFGLIVMSILLCNIQVLKTVELFGLTTTLGNVLYASTFLATDILSEVYGKAEARKGVLLGFAALVLATAYMQIALLFTPAPDDFAQPHLAAIFGFLPRVVLASMAAYLVSQWHDVWAFHYIRARTGGRHLWLRNNASTAVSQLIDSVIFCTLAFAGVFPLGVWLEILVSTYLIKFFVAALDTPFVYLARHLAARRAEPAQAR
jgi:uncharacterized integral membrane protein (TIGR00697 family)